MTIDTKAIRAAAEAVTPIYTDLLGDRYFSGDYSVATLTKEQDDFVATTNPATVIELLDRLEAAEKDAARYRWLREQHWCESEATFRLNLPEGDAIEYEYALDKAIDAAMEEQK